MQEVQLKACHIIMEKIYRRPISKMFFKTDPLGTKKDQISLEIICEKLTKNAYKTADEWIFEIRFVFSAGIVQKKNLFKAAAARFLIEEFEKEMEILSPMVSPHVLKLQIAEHYLTDFCQTYNPKIPTITPINDSYPVSEIFKFPLTKKDYTPERLVSDINLINSPCLILRIAGYVYNIKPGAICFSDRLTILISSLNDDELTKVIQFVRKVMYDAATGNIDPNLYPVNRHPKVIKFMI